MVVMLVLVVVVIIGMPLVCVETIPPHSATISAMIETQVRIHMYMTANRDYPRDLSVLPVRNGYANRATDGWERPLIYKVDDEGVISLTSLGRDGKVGGEGDDADIVRRYRTRNDDGSLNIDDEYWIIYSEIPDGAD